MHKSAAGVLTHRVVDGGAIRGQHLLEQLADRIGLLRLKWLKLFCDAHHPWTASAGAPCWGPSGGGVSGPNTDGHSKYDMQVKRYC